jgi:two-component system, chemotaxis family, CheB/CheR fusion protein
MAKRKISETAADGGSSAALPQPAFCIVGLGASAGGLEAFEQFFRKVAPDSGLAYIQVPHLDPGHASILTEILQRCASIPVVEALDQARVVPNPVYVIPPNREMAIFHGMLQLSVPEMPHGLRMPIDAFMRSLAEDQGDRAILGAGGMTLVQYPAVSSPSRSIRMYCSPCCCNGFRVEAG